MTREDKGLDIASGDIDPHVNGIHKTGVFSSPLSEIHSEVCVGLIDINY